MAPPNEPSTPRNRGIDDAPHVSPVTPAEDARSIMINTVSWGAVFAGVVVALTTLLILNMIGIGIGAATLDPGTSDNPAASTLSIGAGVWFGAALILAALAGGIAAGRLSGRTKASTARWHGLTSWALMALLVVWMIGSSVGSLIGGAFGTLSSVVGGVANVAGNVAGAASSTIADAAGAALPDSFAGVEQSLRSVVPADANPAQARDSAIAAVRAAVTAGPDQADAAKQQAAQAVSTAFGIPLPEAQARVDQLQTQYNQAIDSAQQAAEQAKQAAIDAADVATKAVARSALIAAVGLVLAGIAAWIGGGLGTVEPTVTARRRV